MSYVLDTWKTSSHSLCPHVSVMEDIIKPRRLHLQELSDYLVSRESGLENTLRLYPILSNLLKSMSRLF